MRLILIVLLSSLFALSACAPQEADVADTAAMPEADALAGVWQVAERSGTNEDGDWTNDPVQPSMYLFVDGFYSIMQVQGNEPRPLMAEDATRDTISEEEMRAIFMPFTANSGTYEIDGSTVTFRPVVALWPNFMEGGSWSVEFSVEDRVMTLSQEDSTSTFMAKLTRLN